MFAGYEAGTDSFINILYTFDGKDELSGAIVNVPCPAQTCEHAWEYYAGFWHNVREKLEKQYGDIGLICQAAASGDLAPRQMHYKSAELRRYKLKYPELVREYEKNPMKGPDGRRDPRYDNTFLGFMQSEDIANRITVAFNEVLSWASKERKCVVPFKHEVKTVQLSRRMFSQELVEEEKRTHEMYMKKSYQTGGDKWEQFKYNSTLSSRRARVAGVLARVKIQHEQPAVATDIHVVRLGDVSFATNRFELFIDFMHRIQGRSPFVQTFIVQLVTDRYGAGTYLATERAVRNKGYSATPYCNIVSYAGGQQLVDETVNMLKDMKK
jgi:hypothetical protein